MRVLVIGASGAIGARLVPRLRERGHEVIGTAARPTRPGSCARSAPNRSRWICWTRGRHARSSWTQARGDHPPGDRAGRRGLLRNLDSTFAQTNRLRTEGTDTLLAAAREAGVRRFVAQSFAPFRYAREGGPVKTEDDPLDPAPPKTARQGSAAMRHLDEAVTAAGGIALRYGGFYGAANDGLVPAVRKRQFPIVGDGGGMMSFIHLDDAAAATVLALEDGRPGIYNITDDEPAPVRDWLPVLAEALGAGPPRHVATLASPADHGRWPGDGQPRPAAPRTPRPRPNSAGRSATRAGARASPPPIGRGNRSGPGRKARRGRRIP